MGFQIGIKDIVDIVLVAFLLYQMFKLLTLGSCQCFWHFGISYGSRVVCVSPRIARRYFRSGG